MNTVPIESGIYTGHVTHHRYIPTDHRFRYRVQLAYLDLGETVTALGQLPWRRLGRLAPLRFDRRDYLRPTHLPLDEAIRRHVSVETGARPEGPVRLLTQMRTLGWLFNPLSVYFCFEPDGTTVQALVLEVTNTPWHDRHAYVIDTRDGRHAVDGHWFDKALHVSPFMGMNQRYHLALTDPSQTLRLQMNSHEDGRRLLAVSMKLKRQPWTSHNWRALLVSRPWSTLAVTGGIYRQAAGLLHKRAPIYPRATQQIQPIGGGNYGCLQDRHRSNASEVGRVRVPQ